MKKIFLTLLSLSLFVTVYAQKTLPEIKAGTIIGGSAYTQGQELPLVLTLKSLKDPFSMEWSVDGYGDGTFEMTNKALESGTQMYAQTPGLGLTKLADTETFGLISRAAYKTFIDSKTLTYSGVKFKSKTSDSKPMKISGKEIDLSHLISEDGKIELWILNNPQFPLLLQSTGLPIDITMTEIK